MSLSSRFFLVDVTMLQNLGFVQEVDYKITHDLYKSKLLKTMNLMEGIIFIKSSESSSYLRMEHLHNS
jgi:hypothetical protein